MRSTTPSCGPYPGQKMGPSLAEKWQESADGKTYEFTLRPGLKFHNGDALTAEDVKFSFERYKGAGASILHEHVDGGRDRRSPHVVRFHLKEAWPDFMTFYGTTAVRRRHRGAEALHRDRSATTASRSTRSAPVPTSSSAARRASKSCWRPIADYWRRVPNVKTLVMRSVPEATTRALMVKTGEADIGYRARRARRAGPEGRAGRANRREQARLHLLDRICQAMGSKLALARPRVRLAANYALNRKEINEAACLGFCPPAGVIVPRVMEFALQVEALPYDPAKAKAAPCRSRLPEWLRCR